MSHVTNEWVMSNIRMTQTKESCHTHEWVMSHTWMSRVTHMNGSCHTYEWVMSHLRMRHVTHMNGSCHTHEWCRLMRTAQHVFGNTYEHTLTKTVRAWRQQLQLHVSRDLLCTPAGADGMSYDSWVVSHIWMCHVTHTNEPWHTYEWVMSNVRMGHVTPMNESCHTYEGVTSHVWMSHVTHMHKYMMALNTRRCWWYVSQFMSHVTRMNESCQTYEWVMSHIWMSHVTYMSESRHIYVWIYDDSAHPQVLMVCLKIHELCPTYERVTSQFQGTSISSPLREWVRSHIWMSPVTLMNESRHRYEWVTSHIWVSHVIYMYEYMTTPHTRRYW